VIDRRQSLRTLVMLAVGAVSGSIFGGLGLPAAPLLMRRGARPGNGE
jgi:hypothetical protein